MPIWALCTASAAEGPPLWPHLMVPKHPQTPNTSASCHRIQLLGMNPLRRAPQDPQLHNLSSEPSHLDAEVVEVFVSAVRVHADVSRIEVV